MVGDRRRAVDGAPAGRPGRYLVADEALGQRVRERTVGEMIEAARAAGAPVERREAVRPPSMSSPGSRPRSAGSQIDARARAADGLYAAGPDAGGISTGGWASALASALVLGKIAAEDALS